MKYVKQVLIILLFTSLGELLEWLIPLPIPAAIYGLVLLLIALCSGILKPAHIDETARFLISTMPVLYIAPGVKILQNWGIIAPHVGAIAIICVVSTWVVFAVAGTVTQLLIKKKGGAENE